MRFQSLWARSMSHNELILNSSEHIIVETDLTDLSLERKKPIVQKWAKPINETTEEFERKWNVVFHYK